MPKSVLLVDIRLWAYMCYHRNQPLLNVLEDVANVPISTFSRIYWCFDTYSSHYHKAIYPEYKENRTVLRAKQTDAEKRKYAEFSRQYKEFKEITKYFGTNISIPYTEADTMIEVLADKFATEGYDVYIASSDGDFSCMLSNPKISQITAKYEMIDAEQLYKKKGATPEQLFLSKCISGDQKDNLKGLQGLGEISSLKTGIKIKKIFNEIGSNPEDVINALQHQVDIGKLKLPEDYPCTNVQELYDFNYKLNKAFVFSDLTTGDQELLKEQVNIKKVPFDVDEFNRECFEIFGRGVMLLPHIKGFYNVK